MALPRELNENERGAFALHGITGYLIAVVLLLSILAFLTINAIKVQNANAETFYTVNQDLQGLKFISPENIKQRTLK